MSIEAENPKSIKEKSTRELFEDTLEGNYNDERPWNAVWELHKRGTLEVFQIAVEFCNSTDPLRRARGVGVMGQFGQKYPNDGRELLFFEERVSFAIELLKDKEPRVASSAARALAHLEGSRAVEDTDDDVRDWATFGLGVSTVDSPQIREAFRKNLNDPFLDVSQEAIWGLARRSDRQGLRLLLEQLEADVWAAGDEWAACEILALPGDTPVEDLCKGLRQILNL
jgi:HEAT repeat protein